MKINKILPIYVRDGIYCGDIVMKNKKSPTFIGQHDEKKE